MLMLPPLMVAIANRRHLYDFQQVAGLPRCKEHSTLHVHTRVLPWAESVQEST